MLICNEQEICVASISGHGISKHQLREIKKLKLDFLGQDDRILYYKSTKGNCYYKFDKKKWEEPFSNTPTNLF